MLENARQNYDEVIWDKNDEEWEEAQKAFSKKSLCRRMEVLVAEKFGRPATWITPMIIGGFNNLYQIRVEDLSSDVLVRRPSVSQIQFPQEKTLREAATAKYILQNTKIPAPKVFYYSEFSDLGPFIIIEYIKNKSTLSHALTTPGVDRSITHALDPNISQTTLEDLYFKVARIFLELSHHRFTRIGSLLESDDGSFLVGGRPITQNMNDMVQLANIPSAILEPEYKTFQSSDEYYVNLALGHLVQLTFQRNDLVKSADDCRNKYVARQLFYQLAKEGRLSIFGFAEDNWSAQAKTKNSNLPAPSNLDSFRLYGDDFRPGNMLINDANEIISVIDWEFTYSAPTQFVLDPPWWILLDTPEMWDAGIEDWVKNYELRLETWLSAMKEAEKLSAETNSTKLPLSVYMRESWEMGRFWLTYAARKSWAFDTVFWEYLDERFFGRREGCVEKSEFWKTRVHLLSESARDAMEPFVEQKVEEMKERKLVEWDPEAAKSRLAEVIFDLE